MADVDAVDPARLEPVLDGAALLGAELDTAFRVLALTFEPTPEQAPWGSDTPDGDRRVQVLCHPVSTLLVALRQRAEGGERLLELDVAHLVDVVAALDAPPVRGPFFGGPEPRVGEWAPRWSLEGRATVGDGVATTLRIEVAADDLDLGLFARFDHVEVRDHQGRPRQLG